MSPTWSTFLFETANFLLLAALLGWAFFRPVRGALERRRAELEREDREAAAKLADAERAQADAAAKRSELEGSLAALRDRVRQEAEAERARMLDAAREQAQRERSALEAELAALRRAQSKQVAGDAAAAAREIVTRLLARIDGPELERALADAAQRELGRLAGGGALAPVIVESAADLAQPVLEAIAKAAGVESSQISVRRVPELAAGLRILTSRGLVDASALGLAAHAERALAERFDAEAAGDG